MTGKNPRTEDLASRQVQEAIRGHWIFFLVQGLIMVVLGLIAVAEPVIATFDMEVFIGWLLSVAGIVGIAGVFTRQRVRGFQWMSIAALLAIAIGVYLIWRPTSGILSLALAAVIFFGAQGVAQFLVAIAHRAALTTWVWMLLSSVINFGFVVIILSGARKAAPWELGLMFGINLFMWGVALVMTALACRAIPNAPQMPSAATQPEAK